MYNLTFMAFVAQDAIKLIIADAISPQMKAAKYRKSAFSWRKDAGEVTRVLNVQLSSGNSHTEGKFTINLGVYQEDFHRELHGREAGPNIKEYDCDLRLRIGHLMGVTDQWWMVSPDTNLAALADEVSRLIGTQALPYLERMSNLYDLLGAFEARHSYFDAAVAAHLLGESGVADRLQRAREQGHANFQRFIDAWAQKHAIESA